MKFRLVHQKFAARRLPCERSPTARYKHGMKALEFLQSMFNRDAGSEVLHTPATQRPNLRDRLAGGRCNKTGGYFLPRTVYSLELDHPSFLDESYTLAQTLHSTPKTIHKS